jgi:hypothetical protein
MGAMGEACGEVFRRTFILAVWVAIFNELVLDFLGREEAQKGRKKGVWAGLR